MVAPCGPDVKWHFPGTTRRPIPWCSTIGARPALDNSAKVRYIRKYEYIGRWKMSKLTYVRQAELFGTLAHPVRLQILDILADGEACVCHLSAALHQRQAYVSQQLARLKEAALIVDRKDGLFVYYNLANAGIMDLLHEARQRLGRMSIGESLLQPEPRPRADKKCPCPKCQAARTLRPGSASEGSAN